MFVPPNFQVAFVNFVAIFWSAYMSYMKNQKVVDDNAVDETPTIDYSPLLKTTATSYLTENSVQ